MLCILGDSFLHSIYWCGLCFQHALSPINFRRDFQTRTGKPRNVQKTSV